MIAYVTYNDPPSGIYKSQVVDTVAFYRKHDIAVVLITFVSVRNYRSWKKKFKALTSDIIVLPSFPGIKHWRKNKRILQFYLNRYKVTTAIGRGLFATDLLLKCKTDRVVFDARGAYKAEWEEFKFGAAEQFINQIPKLEEEVLEKSDFRIAVSAALVEYWRTNYHYKGKEMDQHVVIPCTLNKAFSIFTIDEEAIERQRKAIGFQKDHIVLVYSGSVAGWQSIDYWVPLLENIMKKNDKVAVLFLTQPTLEIDQLSEKFPDRVKRFWLSPDQVAEYLSLADIGLLIRKPMDTNKVASPTKFAEYLAVGLKVAISDGVGDYSRFVENQKCGFIFSDQINPLQLSRTGYEERFKNQALAREKLTKENFKTSYFKAIGK